MPTVRRVPHAALAAFVLFAIAATLPVYTASARTKRISGSVARAAVRASSAPSKLIWSDEFTGRGGATPDSTKWQIITGGSGFGNQELQYYTARSSNVATDGTGHLAITAQRERYTGPDGTTRYYTSAALQTKGLFQTTYGRLEARIWIPAGRGLWPAFWAVGANTNSVGWPHCGEIDMMENLGQDPFTIFGTIHGPQNGRPSGYGLTTPYRSSTSLAAGYHVYGIEWRPNQITFTIDGVPYSTRTPASLPAGGSWVFNQPFFLIVNLAVGGSWPGAPDSSTHFPARMLVDWVRVYS